MNHTTYNLSIRTWILVLLLLPIFVSGQELLKMPKPTHTEAGVPCATLTVVKEIEPDFDEDLFFAVPWKITVSKRGKDGRFYIYVFDSKMLKIFIFNEKYEYVGQFLDQGRGPGEVFPGFPSNKEIHSAIDGKLYVHDAMSDRIIQFSATGKYLKDIKLKRTRRSMTSFPPIVDKDGFFYAYSLNNGIVDKLDQKMNPVHTYLDMKRNGRFVVYEPPIEKYFRYRNMPNKWLTAGKINTFYDFTTDGHLLIYLYRSSTVFLFNGDKLVRQFDVLIESALRRFRKRAEKAYKIEKSRKKPGLRQIIMFNACFVDKDELYFYLQLGEENMTCTLYKFDLSGKLVEIIKNIPARIIAKCNSLYYGLSLRDRHPVIFKKEDSK
jgi:hypothetical protein